MPFLQICGFEIHTARGGGEDAPERLGAVDRMLDGSPGGGVLNEVEGGSWSTPLIRLAEARAILNLCRSDAGHVWHCDNSVYAADGTALAETPTFSAAEKQFGTHSIDIASGGGAGDIDVISSMATKHTVAGWNKDGAGAWTHYVERSDGAKWVDAVRNDLATPPWTIAAGTWTLDQHATNQRYFDDLVYMPFEIWDDWGLEWPQTEAFADLPDLKVYGDFLPGFEFDARVRGRLTYSGRATFGGTETDGAVVALSITGGVRSERA